MSKLKEELENLKYSFGQFVRAGPGGPVDLHYTSRRVEILIEAVLRIEAEQYDTELKINTFNNILDEYDEVITRLQRLLIKYEEENKGLKEMLMGLSRPAPSPLVTDKTC